MLRSVNSRFRLHRAKTRGWIIVGGQRLHFPPDSEAATRFARQNSYEPELTELMAVACRSEGMMFDVGANIGISAIPVLARFSNIRVVSFEVSPVVLPFLQRTYSECAFSDRWEIVPKAATELPGEMLSFTSHTGAGGVYDGLRETNRAPTAGIASTVESTSLDHEWESRGRPSVSLIKVDVEGGELGVLRGAAQCLRHARPTVLTEWYHGNFSSYITQAEAMLDFADSVGYDVYTAPGLVPANDRRLFAYLTAVSYDFLLLPRPGGS